VTVIVMQVREMRISMWSLLFGIFVFITLRTAVDMATGQHNNVDNETCSSVRAIRACMPVELLSMMSVVKTPNIICNSGG